VSLKTSEAFTDFVPPLLKRVEALPSEMRTEYFKELIQYLTRVLTITNRFSLESEQLVEEYFKVSVIDPTIFERIQQDLEENIQSDIVIPKDDTITKVKRDFINEMMALAAGLIKSKEQITIFLCLYIEPEEVNQDQIMEVTGYSRSTISEALKHLVNLEAVKVIKRAGDRKKYYALTQNIMDYGFSKLNWWRKSTKLITYMMKERFIPKLEKIDADPEEKKRLRNFFAENSENYTHLMEYVEKLYKYIEENNTRLPNL
jgi:DNA-binding transcriptional regulator GbsR (MarR family)